MTDILKESKGEKKSTSKQQMKEFEISGRLLMSIIKREVTKGRQANYPSGQKIK